MIHLFKYIYIDRDFTPTPMCKYGVIVPNSLSHVNDNILFKYDNISSMMNEFKTLEHFINYLFSFDEKVVIKFDSSEYDLFYILYLSCIYGLDNYEELYRIYRTAIIKEIVLHSKIPELTYDIRNKYSSLKEVPYKKVFEFLNQYQYHVYKLQDVVLKEISIEYLLGHYLNTDDRTDVICDEFYKRMEIIFNKAFLSDADVLRTEFIHGLFNLKQYGYKIDIFDEKIYQIIKKYEKSSFIFDTTATAKTSELVCDKYKNEIIKLYEEFYIKNNNYDDIGLKLLEFFKEGFSKDKVDEYIKFDATQPSSTVFGKAGFKMTVNNILISYLYSNKNKFYRII